MTTVIDRTDVAGREVTLGRFVNVAPIVVSLVDRPSSHQQYEVRRALLTQNMLQTAEAAGCQVARSERPEVAKAVLTVRGGGSDEHAQVMSMRIVRVDEAQRIVYGLAYCPPLDVEDGGTITESQHRERVDTYGTFMDAATLRELAHAYMEQSRGVDVMHSFEAIQAVPVESTIVRANDPDFPEGSWLLAVRVTDDDAWVSVRSGVLKGFSIAVYADFEPVTVTVVADPVDNPVVGVEEPEERTIRAEDDMITRNQLPLAADDYALNADEARVRVAQWASSDGSGATETVDMERYSSAFLRVAKGEDEAVRFEGCSLMFADVIDGELRAVGAELRSVSGCTDLEDADREALEPYLREMGVELPWADDASSDDTAGKDDDASARNTDEPGEGAAQDAQTADPIPEGRGEDDNADSGDTGAEGDDADTRSVRERMSPDMSFEDALVDELAKMEPARRIWNAIWLFEDYTDMLMRYWDDSGPVDGAVALTKQAGKHLADFVTSEMKTLVEAYVRGEDNGVAERLGQCREALVAMRKERAPEQPAVRTENDAAQEPKALTMDDLPEEVRAMLGLSERVQRAEGRLTSLEQVGAERTTRGQEAQTRFDQLCGDVDALKRDAGIQTDPANTRNATDDPAADDGRPKVGRGAFSEGFFLGK